MYHSLTLRVLVFICSTGRLSPPLSAIPMSDPAAAVTGGKPISDAEKAANPLFGKAPSAEKLAKMQAKEAKKKAAAAAAAAASGAPAADAAAAGGAAASSAPSAATIRALEYQPKVPKGTRDSTPEQMAIREKVHSRIHFTRLH